MARSAPAADTSAALVPVAQYAIASPDMGDFMDAVRENLAGGVDLSILDRIKVPSGGGLAWKVPTLDGKPKMLEAIEGIIVHHQMQRAYWSQPFTGAGTPPDCSSGDAEVGRGHPGGACAACPLAQYGTAMTKEGTRGRGQACKQIYALYVMRPDELLPVVIPTPPTSIKTVQLYLARLTKIAKPFYGVTTRFTLTEAKNNDGIEYAEMVVERGEDVPREVTERIREMRGLVAKVAREVNAADFGGDDAQGEPARAAA